MIDIHNIFTLSLIFHIQANTEKLNQTNMVNTVKIAHQDSSVHENTNFCPKSINAISGHTAIINTANKKEKTKKYV
jgi:hypothetical protein